jgi:hypothetical protein
MPEPEGALARGRPAGEPSLSPASPSTELDGESVVPASGGPRSASMDAAHSVISEFKNRCSNADDGKEAEAL